MRAASPARRPIPLELPVKRSRSWLMASWMTLSGVAVRYSSSLLRRRFIPPSSGRVLRGGCRWLVRRERTCLLGRLGKEDTERRSEQRWEDYSAGELLTHFGAD